MSSGWQTGESVYLHMAAPRVLESFDSVRGEDEIESERTILQLDKILAAFDLGYLRRVESKAESQEGLR